MKTSPLALVAAGLLSVPALTFVTAALVAEPAFANVQVGQTAPNFRAKDINDHVVSLSDFRGKTVVLEWNNPECPFVQKHYKSGNMQKTQAAAAADGAVWLTINSSAVGKQGYMTPVQARRIVAGQGSRRTDYLLDPNGIVGKGYGAKTTPHMYVINRNGKLVYMGGIDDKPTADPADIRTAHNFVLAALNDLKAGKAVSVPTSRPYGCSVKYKDVD